MASKSLFSSRFAKTILRAGSPCIRALFLVAVVSRAPVLLSALDRFARSAAWVMDFLILVSTKGRHPTSKETASRRAKLRGGGSLVMDFSVGCQRQMNCRLRIGNFASPVSSRRGGSREDGLNGFARSCRLIYLDFRKPIHAAPSPLTPPIGAFPALETLGTGPVSGSFGNERW